MNDAEIAKIEDYIAQVVVAVEGIDFDPRGMRRLSIRHRRLINDVKILGAGTVVHLPAQGQTRLTRPTASLAHFWNARLILRYMTSDQVLQTSRAAQYLEFSFDHKYVWAYHARRLTASTSSAGEVERLIKKWNLSGDPTKARTTLVRAPRLHLESTRV